MLQLILGRSGSGKSTLLQQKMADCLKSGEEVFFLVPEQFSFESECNLASSMAGPDFFRLQVLSFTRLALRIFESCGEMPRFLDGGGKALLAAKAAMQMQDRLQVYAKAIHAKGFTEKLVRFFDEAAACAISPLRLEEAAYSLPEAMRLRLLDLAALYAGYEQLVSTGPMDPADCLIPAAAAAAKTKFFANGHWFIDGFDRFSKAQLQLLGVLLADANSVTLAITGEGLSDKDGGFGLFSQNHQTIEEVLSLAKERGVSVANPIFLTQNKRAKNEALTALEEGFLAKEQMPLADTKGSLRLISAPSVYEEWQTVCALIREMVEKEGYRYKDFVVVTGDNERDGDLVRHTFERYGIPLFLDRREKVSTRPLAVLIAALLDIPKYGYRTEDILRYAKTGGLCLDDKTLSALENYVYIWQIDHGRWKQPFTLSPAGLQGEMNKEDKEALTALEEARKKIILPILAFEKATKDADGHTFALALWQFLEDNHIQIHLEKEIEALPFEQQTEKKEESRRVLAAVIALLEQFEAHFATEKVDISLFSRLYDLLIAQYTLGEVPNTLDSVLLGQAGRLRADNRKVCIITGFVQGAWPMEGESDSLVTLRDRRALLEQEVDLGGLEEAMSAREDFNTYAALTSATEKLILTYAEADRNYAPLLPSRYLTQITALFTDLEKESYNDLPYALFVRNRETLTALTAAALKQKDQKSASLFTLLSHEAPNTAKRLQTAAKPKIWKLEDPELTKQLFGSPVRLSASRVERFFGCKFAYFAEYALRLQARRRAEIAPLEAGSLIHSLLEQAILSLGVEGIMALSEEEAKAWCKERVYAYVNDNFCNTDSLSARQKAKLTRISSNISLMLRRLAMEFSETSFLPTDVELPLGDEEKGLPAFTLQTPAGNKISVTGSIDRVDVMIKGDKKYVRVVDYKSGGKTFSLQDVFFGLNLQMLIYLFAIWRDGKEKYGDCIPAGVLYFPATASWLEEESAEDKESLLKKFPLQGLILDDPEVLDAMDPEGKGVYIPSARRKNGSRTKEETLATLAQIGSLRAHVEKALLEMADQLMQGRIEAVPRISGPYVRCDRCAYQAICQNEMAEKTLPVEDMDKATFYALLAEEEAGSDSLQKEKGVSDPWQ